MRLWIVPAALVLQASFAQATESLWISLEASRLLAVPCPAEFRQIYGDLAPAQLGGPIATIRQREVSFTARVGTNGDVAAAERAMDAYATRLADQVRAGLTQFGCKQVFEKLGLRAAQQAIAYESIVRAAAEAPLRSSERPGNLPESERIGTEAAYPLQKLLLRVLANPGERACDPATARAAPISRKTLDAPNAPPFVGRLELFTERWDLTCKGVPTTHTITFRQDARDWRGYSIDSRKD